MKVFDSLKTFIMKEAYAAFEDKADFLKKAGIAGVVTTAVCQVTAVLINKEVPKKEKKFMLAQEVTDGAINLAIFWGLTSLCIKKGRAYAEKLTKNGLSGILENESQKDAYIGGISSIIGMTGSIFANTIFSPPLRNYAASIYQKESMKLTANQDVISKNSVFNRPDQNNLFAQQKPVSQYGNMSLFLNQSKYSRNNPLRPLYHH
jgi:hypothetical protein